MRATLALALVLSVSWGHAASGPGAAGSPLLAQPVGARPLALGASYVALSDDSLAGLWNPAGLVQLGSPEVGLTYQREPGEVTYGYLLYAQPLVLGQSVSAAIGTLSTADVDFVDLVGNPGSIAGESDWLVAVSYATSLYPFLAAPNLMGTSLSAGLTLKYLRTSLGGDLRGQASTADLGMLFTARLMENFLPTRVGAVWQNAGARIKLGSKADPVANPLRLGVAQTMMENRQAWTTMSLEAVKILTRRDTALHLGLEQVWKPQAGMGVAVRAGYRFGVDLPGLSGGVGIRWSRFVLDYAVARLGKLGAVQRASLRVRWKGACSKAPDRSQPPRNYHSFQRHP